MSDLQGLKKRIKELEIRLDRLEKRTGNVEEGEDAEWMNQLYERAVELVVKNNKASAIFLQRKLLIDFQRAMKLIRRLEENGVVGKAGDGEPRKVLV